MSQYNHIVINSANRISGTSSDFQVKTPMIARAKSVSLQSASIPNTIYNITTKNKYLEWFVDGTIYADSLTPGAYSITDITAALSTLMSTATGEAYQVSYIPVTMRLNIKAPTAFSIIVGANSAWKTLGFPKNTTSALTHTGSEILRLDLPAYLLIQVSELGGSQIATTAGNWGSFYVAMTKNSEYVETPSRATLAENNHHVSSEQINLISVRVADCYGNPVDLNNADWSMVLNICYCSR